MLDKQTLHALELVAHIACAPAQQSTTTATLARQLGLSVTYVEGLMKQLKRGDLLQAHRGPGGGYRLQKPVESISAGDVARCFAHKDAAAARPDASTKANSKPSAERSAVNQLSVQFDEFTQHFLQDYPMSALVDAMDHPPAANTKSGFSLNLKELPKITLPSAPNSVFDLCNFISRSASYGMPANPQARRSVVRPSSNMVEKSTPFKAPSNAWVLG